MFIPRFLGYIITFIIILGIYFSTEKRKYLIAVSSLVLLFFALLFYRFEIEFFLPYRRTLMYLFVIFSVAFGAGCEGIIDLFKPKKLKLLSIIILTALILIVALPAKLDSSKQFYHVINKADYNAFQYIKSSTPQNSIVLADPWISNAITPIAERQVYSRIVQGPNEESEAKNEQAQTFLRNNCTNTTFLKQNNISVIYGTCNSPDLEEVYTRVYFLR